MRTVAELTADHSSRKRSGHCARYNHTACGASWRTVYCECECHDLEKLEEEKMGYGTNESADIPTKRDLTEPQGPGDDIVGGEWFAMELATAIQDGTSLKQSLYFVDQESGLDVYDQVDGIRVEDPVMEEPNVTRFVVKVLNRDFEVQVTDLQV